MTAQSKLKIKQFQINPMINMEQEQKVNEMEKPLPSISREQPISVQAS